MPLFGNQTAAGRRRDHLTGLFQDRADMDPDKTVAFLCNQMSLQDLEDAATACGLVEEPAAEHEDGPDDDTEDDDDDDADADAP